MAEIFDLRFLREDMDDIVVFVNRSHTHVLHNTTLTSLFGMVGGVN